MTVKVTVRVKTATHEFSKTKKVQQQGEKEIVVLRKPSNKDLGWILELPPGSIITRNKLFGRISRFADALPDAPQAIVYTSNLKSGDMPKYDKKTSAGLIGARILDKAGEEQKEKSSAGLWALAILQVITLIAVVLGTHVIRIG